MATFRKRSGPAGKIVWQGPDHSYRGAPEVRDSILAASPDHQQRDFSGSLTVTAQPPPTNRYAK